MTKTIKSHGIMPIPYEVEAGSTYQWCGCGQTSTVPLCDGQGDCDKRVAFDATLNETVYFCGCCQTKHPPLCDGTHGQVMLGLIKD